MVMSDYTRLEADKRKALILSAAITVANNDGLGRVNFDSVSAACRVETSRHTVKHYFPTKAELVAAVIKDDRVTRRVLDTASAMGLSV